MHRIQSVSYTHLIINFVPDADAKSNEETMLDEIKNVKTGQVTYAVRDTHIDDKEIHQGDIMGIGDAGKMCIRDRYDHVDETKLFQCSKTVRYCSRWCGKDVYKRQ